MDTNPPKIFLAIISCHKNASRVKILRETWLPTLSQYPYIEYKIFVGKCAPGFLHLEGDDVVQLDCSDDYDHLPQKMLTIFKHSYENYNFDYFFKCDDDNYLDLSLFDYKKDLLPYSGLGIIKYGFIPGCFYIHKRNTIKYFLDHADEVPETGAEDVIFADIFKSLQNDFSNFNCLVKCRDTDRFYGDVMFNRLLDIRKSFITTYYQRADDKINSKNNDFIVKSIHQLKTKYNLPKGSNYTIDCWKLQDKTECKVTDIFMYSDTNVWWTRAFAGFGSVTNKDNEITFTVDHEFDDAVNKLKDEVFRKYDQDGVYESEHFILIKVNKPLDTINQLWIKNEFAKDITMVGPSWEGAAKLGYYRVEKAPVGTGAFEIIDLNSFNIIWDNYAIEKFYYNEENRTAVVCPFSSDIAKLKGPELEYSDKDTVALFYNDYTETLNLKSTVYLPYSFIATILMYLDHGYKVKLYCHQTIEEEASLKDKANFEIIDANTVLVPPTNILQTSKTFDTLFKLACVCSDVNQVFVSPGIVANQPNSLPFGFTKSLSYINFRTVDDAVKNSIIQLKQAFSSLVSIQINEASDDVFIKNFIVPFIQEHMKDITDINFEIPVWSQHFLTRLSKHIDVVNKLIKIYPMMEIAPSRFDLLENFDKISYGSYIGQYYLI